jgi:hypothetical protein
MERPPVIGTHTERKRVIRRSNDVDARTNRTCVLARPTGVGRALTAYRMPIEGRDEWIAAAGRRMA